MALFGLHNGIGRNGASAAVPLSLEKVLYTNVNTVRQCNPDLTGDELLYTWAAATRIDSLAVDHVNQRILMVDPSIGIIHGIDYDAGNPSTLHTMSGTFAEATLTIAEAAGKLIWSEGTYFASTIQSVDVGGGTRTQISSDGMTPKYIPELDKVLYVSPSGTDGLKTMDIDGTNITTISLFGGATGGVEYDAGSANYFAFDRVQVIRTRGTRDANWASSVGEDYYQGEIDRITNTEMYVITSSSNAAGTGIWKFTDIADSGTTNTTHDDFIADLNVGATGADVLMGLALRYNRAWQSEIL